MLAMSTQDAPHALALFRQACDAKNQDGCGNLGTMYLKGIGVAQDPVHAIELLTPSCTDHFLDACGSLGLAYGLGLGVPADQWRLDAGA